MKHARDVLIVDDDPIAQSIYKSFFASIGTPRTHGATTGKHAVMMLASEAAEVDLIVLDLNMPEMDGIEFLKHLRQLRYAGRLVIGSASHRANVQSAQRLAVLYGLNLVGFISKPLTKSKLEQALNLGRSNPQAESANSDRVLL